MSEKQVKRKAPKSIPIHLRVKKGYLEPADSFAASQLRQKGYSIGDVLAVTLKKLNNPAFHRLIHRIGQLCAANIEAFIGMDAHAVLKRLQWESGVHCEECGVMVPGIGLAVMRFPLSWAFDSMDDAERHEAGRGLCRWIAKTYWVNMTPEQIEEMAESFVDEI